MANLFRLAVAACFVLFCGALWAAGVCYDYSASYNGRTTGWFPKADDACAGLNGAYPVGGTVKSRTVSGGRADPSDPSRCLITDTVVYESATSTNNVAAPLNSRVGTCPPTQCEGGRERDSSGQCVCKAGTVEPSGGVGACVPAVTDDSKCASAALLHNSVGTNRIGRISGKHPLGIEVKVCRDSGVAGNSGQPLGCLHLFTGEVSFKKPDGWVTEGESWALTDSAAGNGAGLACALGLDKDPDKPEDANKVPEEKKPDGKCPGGYSGTVNGINVCVDRASGEQNGVDWSRSTDATGAQTEVRTTVSCVGDRCTVTQVRNTTGGSSGGTSSTTVTNDVPRAQVCSTNPKNPVCGVPVGSSTKPGSSGGGGGNGSGDGTCTGDNCGEGDKGSFSGSCAAGFACEGDVLQCAIAKEQHRRNCQLMEDKSDESRLYDAEVAKGRGRDVTKDLPGNETVDVAGKLSAQDLIGGGQCISDLTVTVWRSDVSLPFSKICPVAGYLGYVLVLVASLAAFRIVSGTPKES